MKLKNIFKEIKRMNTIGDDDSIKARLYRRADEFDDPKKYKMVNDHKLGKIYYSQKGDPGYFLDFFMAKNLPNGDPEFDVVPLAYMSVSDVTFGDISGYQVFVSYANPDYKKQGLGERLYIYALNELGIIISDMTQTQYSHALWARLSSRFNVKGLNVADEKNPKIFNVKAHGKELVNADSETPIVYGSDGDPNVLLIMYDESPKTNEIISITMDDDWGHSFANHRIPDNPEKHGTIDGYDWYVDRLADRIKVVVIAKNRKVIGSANVMHKDGRWAVVGIGKGDAAGNLRGIGVMIYDIALHHISDGELYSDTSQTIFSRGVWAKLATEYRDRFKVSGYHTIRKKEFPVRLRTEKDPFYDDDDEPIKDLLRKSLISDDPDFVLYIEDSRGGDGWAYTQLVMKSAGPSHAKLANDTK